MTLNMDAPVFTCEVCEREAGVCMVQFLQDGTSLILCKSCSMDLVRVNELISLDMILGPLPKSLERVVQLTLI